MKILVVGGAGYVGRILKPTLQAEHDYTCFDRNRIGEPGDRCIVGDVGNTDAVAKAVTGMDVVLYLAMGTLDGNPATCGDLDVALNINVRDAYRFIFESLKANVRRFIYASSLSVYKAFNTAMMQNRVHEQIEPNEWRPYGLSKRLGEKVCEAAAQEYPDATIISLRLNRPCNETEFAAPESIRPRFGIGPNDLRRLFLAAIHCAKPGAHSVQASGDLTNAMLPNTRVTELLDWRPQGN